MVLSDRCQPVRDPARQHLRHPGLPVAGKGDRHQARQQPPALGSGNRAAPLERAGPAARRRGRPGEPLYRRRRAEHPDHERRRAQARQVGQGYYGYFADPYNTLRTLAGFVAEILRELVQASRQRRHDVRPRVRRGGLYPFLRAFATVITRDLTTQTLIGDLYVEIGRASCRERV